MSNELFYFRMQELQEGHTKRVERLAAVAAGHAKHNRALERAHMLPKGAMLDPADAQVLYEMTPEQVVQSITREELDFMLGRKVQRR